MSHQLTFELPSRPAFGRDAFFVSPCNALALAQIEDWKNWPESKLMLIGPEGSGKSHLASVWTNSARAKVIAPPYEIDMGACPIVIEDIDRVVQDRDAQEALFHIYNQAHRTRRAVLMTARRAPGFANYSLPDLSSRLQTIPVVEIQAPDDALLGAVLAKHFRDRQVRISQDLLPFLIPRIPRRFVDAAIIAERLDQAALSQRRKLNARFASEMLDKIRPAEA